MRPQDVPGEWVRAAWEAAALHADAPGTPLFILRHALAAVLPEHEATVRAKVAEDIAVQKEECREHPAPFPKPSCWFCGRNGAFHRAARIAQGAFAAPAPRDTETTGSTEGGTDDLDALCNRLANAIRTAVRVRPGADLRRDIALRVTTDFRLSGAEAHDAAHAVMPLVLAERERAEHAEAALQRVRDLHARHECEDCDCRLCWGLTPACAAGCAEYPCPTLRALDAARDEP